MASDSLVRIARLRRRLFTVAKVRWGFGVAFGYLAVIAIPVSVFADWPQWTGPCVAALLSIVGKVLTWYSDSIRRDADWLHKQNELALGLAHSVDETTLAAIQSRYSRHHRSLRSNELDEADYYQAKGTPSPSLLVRMLRESSWWTQELARKASWTVGLTLSSIVALSLIAVIVVARVENSPVLLTVYALSVCVILATDTAYLAARYRALSAAARESFGALDALNTSGSVKEGLALTVVADYQMARANGPLVPDWFKRCHEEALQEIWNETLSDRS